MRQPRAFFRAVSPSLLALGMLCLPFAILAGQDTVPASAARAQRLDAVTISEHAARVNAIVGEVNQRRRAGFGYFSDSIEISKLPGLREAFNFPNVKTGGTPAAWGITILGRFSNTDADVPLSSSSKREGPSIKLECNPTIWIDGIKTDATVLPMLQKQEIAVLEVFNSVSRVPLKYKDFSQCGAVLLWTRRYMTP